MTRYVIGPDVAIRLAQDQAVIRGDHQILAPVPATSPTSWHAAIGHEQIPQACLVVSFRTLLLSVAAMSAEPAPNKQFYSIRPARRRAPATARCADKAAPSPGGSTITPGNAPPRTYPLALRCRTGLEPGDARVPRLTADARFLALPDSAWGVQEAQRASARASPLVSGPIGHASRWTVTARAATAAAAHGHGIGDGGRGDRAGQVASWHQAVEEVRHDQNPQL
jgi:hypothetical protein